MFGRAGPVEQLLHGRKKVVGDGAADAAIGQLYNVIFRAGLLVAAAQQLAIDSDIAELVDDQRQPAALRILEKVADERGLARA
ncbi:hypothetical protein L485_09640 [Sphingobium baderi LL03]|uniref:Uncharacterized protein n=1 Tax=Sphingobium baderi LL03 TaxID=1114964 RepID=T0GDR1_9SPHN|nr:hypothetical protein L485_09640 [Sphingobium baderi LL03]